MKAGPLQRSLYLTLAVLAVPALASCVSAPAGAPAQGTGQTIAAELTQPAVAAPAAKPAQPAAVKVGTLFVSSDAAALVALDQGYFEDENLQIEAVTFPSAAQMISPLATGQLDAGGGAISPGLLNAIARGLGVRIVADKGREEGKMSTQGLVVATRHVDSGRFKTIADLKGMKVAVSGLGVAGHFVLETGAFPRYGLKDGDIKIETMGFPDMVTAMGTGGIDAAMIIEPLLTNLLSSGTGKLIALGSELVPGTQSGVVLYGTKFMEERPDVAARYMRAYVRGARFYNDGVVKGDQARREAVIASLIKHTRLKERAMYDQVRFQAIAADPRVTPESIAVIQDWYSAKKFVESKVDPAQAIAGAFVEQAISALGPYR